MERLGATTVEGRASDVEAWLTALPDDQRLQVGQLADLIRATLDDVEEAVKWGRLTFTVDGNWHHWLCAIGATKTETKLMFHKGALLDDPSGLLEGEGRYLRSVRHDVATAHPEAVMALIQEAILHQTDMLDD